MRQARKSGRFYNVGFTREQICLVRVILFCEIALKIFTRLLSAILSVQKLPDSAMSVSQLQDLVDVIGCFTPIANAFVMFFARINAWTVSQFVDERMRHWVHFGAVILFEIVFSILGMFVVAAFSRAREYRADDGGATLAGRVNMIAGLKKLKRTIELNDDSQPSLATMKISSAKKDGLMAWMSTHPDLDERIRRLESN